MSVIEGFKFPKDLLEKLAREGGRAWKSTNVEDKADHFFNFCVTSLSLRDWCITYLELEGVKKNDFYEMHSKNEWLNYCGSIANASKHFKLKEGRNSAVKSVESKVSKLVTLGPDGKEIEGLSTERASFDIEVLDGEVKDLLTILFYCVNQWEDVFKEHNIPSPDLNLKMNMFIEYI